MASLPTASLGILFSAGKWSEVLALPVLLYVLLFFLILTFSCQLNCLYDLEVDGKYKRHLSAAVQGLGVRRLRFFVFSELTLSLVLILSLFLLKKRATALLSLLGLAAGYLYSAPPWRLKKRGIVSGLPVMFGLYFLPLPAGALLVKDFLSWPLLVFALGYAALMQGITLVNTGEDFEEDFSCHIRTWAHLLGIRRVLQWGRFFVWLGGITVAAVVLVGYSGWRHGLFLRQAVGGILLLVFLLSVLRIGSRIRSLAADENPCQACKLQARNLPRWFMETRYALFLVALIRLF